MWSAQQLSDDEDSSPTIAPRTPPISSSKSITGGGLRSESKLEPARSVRTPRKPSPLALPISQEEEDKRTSDVENVDNTGAISTIRYKIVKLNASDVGINYCGGKIGNGRKMCIKCNCDRKAHQQKLLELFDSDTDTRLFICATPAGKTESSVNAVFAFPNIAASSLGFKLGEALSSTKSLENWQSLFDTLYQSETSELPQDRMGEDDKAKLLEITGQELPFGVTPKKRKRIAFVPGEAQLIETIGGVMPSSPVWNAMKTPSGTSCDEIVEEMKTEWDRIISNLEQVNKRSLTNRSVADGIQEDFNDTVQQLELKLSIIKKLIGNRPESFGTDSVFGTLQQQQSLLGERPIQFGSSSVFDILKIHRRRLEATGYFDHSHFEELKTEMRNLRDAKDALLARLETSEDRARATTQSQINTGFDRFISSGKFYREFIEPVSVLLGLVSTNVNTPGDRLRRLYKRVKTLEIQPAAQLPGIMSEKTNRPVEFDWNKVYADKMEKYEARLRQLEESKPPARSSKMMWEAYDDLEEEKADRPSGEESHGSLAARIAHLEQKSRREAIMVLDETFTSSWDAGDWIKIHGAHNLAHLFLDPISLLALSDYVKEDPDAHTQSRVLSHKVQDKGGADRSVFVGSFATEIPRILGRKSDPNTLLSDRVLPAVPKFEDWDTRMGRDGVKDRLTRMVNQGHKKMHYIIAKRLGHPLDGKAEALAQEMLSLSRNFWLNLATWMTNYHTEVVARSHSSSKECWILVTHCVRGMLAMFKEARAPGLMESEGELLWGTIRGIKVAMELQEYRFQGHPKVAIKNYQHLIDTLVSASAMEDRLAKVNKEMEEVKGIAAAAKKAVDKAMSKLGNKK